jgi:hypothetical protein
MFIHKLIRLRAGTAGGLLLLVALLAAPGAQAAASVCRTDPIVWLSDGHKVTLSASIGTELSKVQQVTYTLHAPAGLTVSSIVHTAGGLGTKEVFYFYADQPAKHYTTETVVRTSGNTAVTANTAVTVQAGGIVGTASADGTANMTIGTEVQVLQ